ncbi:apolipoprotein N-acyltransferase [Parashewanella curva]|uniref:Apolipoprotein N-acyltransferase n=1 Tax=Parashewanella curva TaxID=2338552 RepID=A0A3L8PZC3_9GAMM|nr:apolipoprotein N-acyltransferase [Parashewanella curva]RLV60129.1 apolipoprotein N-acyltransferase [Parashewanella curva]
MSFISKLHGHKWTRFVAAFLAGASCTLSFAPYDLWGVLPVAFAISLYLGRTLGAKQGFKHWLSFGFGYFAVGISWVHVSMAEFGGIPLIASMLLMALLALYLALFPAFAGYLSRQICKDNHWQHDVLLFPALWVLMEWARGWVLTGFPWLWAGYSQTQGPLSPVAAGFGAIGLSLLLVTLAGALAQLFQKRWQAIAVYTPLLLVLIVIAPKFSNVTPTGSNMKVAMIQGNIPQSTKWQPEMLWPTLLKYMDLSRNNYDADVIIWPEGAIPAPEYKVSDFLANANQSANLNDSAIVTGIISQTGPQTFYNSLVVLGNTRKKHQANGDYTPHSDNEYRKHHLLPIGEFVPFESILRPIAPLFDLPMSSFTRGSYVQPDLLALGYHITPAICFEITFPEQVRNNLKANSDVILTVSNDAWFGTSIGPLQHMQIAQMRAIELGKPVLRATNNGVTAVVNPKGKITEQLPQFKTGILRANVPLMKGETLFYKLGQLPVLLLCGLVVAIGFVYSRKN